MNLICPKDGTACPDDLCRGSGCMAMNGYPMLEQCDFCGVAVDTEIGQDCDCGDDSMFDYDDGEFDETMESELDVMDPRGEV